MPGRHIGGVEVQLYSFLTLAFDEVGWSMLCPCRFTPGKRPGSHLSYRRNGGPWDWSRQTWTIWWPPGFKPQTAHLVAIRYTDYTINFSSILLNYKIHYSSIIILLVILYRHMTLKTALLALTFFKNSFTELQIILPHHVNSLHPDDVKCNMQQWTFLTELRNFLVC